MTPAPIHIDRLILQHLIGNDTYLGKVLPFLKAEYFLDAAERKVFEEIQAFVLKYQARPTKEALLIGLDDARGLPEALHASVIEFIQHDIVVPVSVEEKWLLDATEKFCAEKALYHAIMESITIIDGKSKTHDKGAIPKLLTDALGVSFDTHIGHDFLDDADERFDTMHKVHERIPFDLEYLNKITNGGLIKKTLNILMASTGIGKTMVMCHCAAANLTLGKNVLYVTLEMAEEKIAERIDANLMNVEVDNLIDLTKAQYDQKVEDIRTKTHGKLIIKEYPTAGASVSHIRHLLNDLYLKRNFKPDIIYVDYMNICASARIKMGATINSYTYIKYIAEELRGLAVEQNVPIVTATQTNRAGYGNSDPELTETSESIGGPATADLWLALVSTEDLDALNQIMVKQLKNRYKDMSVCRRFVLGVNKAKMRLYDVPNAEHGLMDGTKAESIDDAPAFNKSAFGLGMSAESRAFGDKKTHSRQNFSGLKTS